jgi:ADP-ribosyl-[dinitrogen reductase] hydrolase
VDLPDRVLGCVLGLALGDALGAPFEFRRAKDVPRPLPAFELPWLGYPPGTTTDDTAMARNLTQSLAARDGFDPDDVIERHLAWFRSDPPDVGTLTRRVLTRIDTGAEAEDAARAVWTERGPEVSAGNGSVMYCAPLGAAYARRPGRLVGLAPALSSLTHVDERCRTAVLAVCLAAAGAVRGEPGELAVRSAVAAVLEREGGEELEFLVDAAGGTRPIDGPDQGFCLFTAAVGLQAQARGGPFEAELSQVVALGGDTDTNAAVAGALLGATAGAGALPRRWLDRLADAERIRDEASMIIPLARRRDSPT